MASSVAWTRRAASVSDDERVPQIVQLFLYARQMATEVNAWFRSTSLTAGRSVAMWQHAEVALWSQTAAKQALPPKISTSRASLNHEKSW